MNAKIVNLYSNNIYIAWIAFNYVSKLNEYFRLNYFYWTELYC